jgi:hypothetical protein
VLSYELLWINRARKLIYSGTYGQLAGLGTFAPYLLYVPLSPSHGLTDVQGHPERKLDLWTACSRLYV